MHASACVLVFVRACVCVYSNVRGVVLVDLGRYDKPGMNEAVQRLRGSVPICRDSKCNEDETKHAQA